MTENVLDLGASQVALVVKNLPANARDIRDVDSIPWIGESTPRHVLKVGFIGNRATMEVMSLYTS